MEMKTNNANMVWLGNSNIKSKPLGNAKPMGVDLDFGMHWANSAAQHGTVANANEQAGFIHQVHWAYFDNATMKWRCRYTDVKVKSTVEKSKGDDALLHTQNFARQTIYYFDKATMRWKVLEVAKEGARPNVTHKNLLPQLLFNEATARYKPRAVMRRQSAHARAT